MTLHSEIESILLENNNTMTTNDIAEEVNIRKNYVKGDGSPISTFQIHGRTKNYPQLFLRHKTLVGLVGRDEDKMERRKEPLKTDLSNKNIQAVSSIMQQTMISINNIDVTNISFLKNHGFENISTFNELITNSFPINHKLKLPGIYAVTIPEEYKFALLDEDIISKNKNVIKPWDFQMLKNKWVPEVDVIYYGIAGSTSPRSLKSRLSDFVEHSAGRTSDRGPHRGGEIIFQLEGWENFNIWVLPTGNPPEPRNTEIELLQRFYQIKNKLPFGNKKF